MGYRSCVVLAVDVEEDAKGRMNPMIESMLDESKVKRVVKDSGIFYKWEEIIWHESHPHVLAITKWMNEMDGACHAATEDPVLYQFMRMGEDYDDVEHRGSLAFGIECVRAIAY